MSQHTTHNSIRAGTVDDNFTFLDNSGNSNPKTQPPTHPPTPANMSTHFGSAHINLTDDDTPASNSHKAKATAFAELSARPLKATTAPRPNYRNQIHSTVPTPRNFALLFYSANSISEIAKIYSRTIPIRSIMSSHS